MTTMQLIPALPDSVLGQATLRLVRTNESPATANHSIRSYLFAAMMAGHRGLEREVDLDLLFLSCVLHDIGLSDKGNGKQRFEVDGADAAAEFLAGQGLPGAKVDLVWEAIALHTSPGIAERRGVLAHLTRAGVGADFGRDVDFISDAQAQELHRTYPRLSMEIALVGEIVAQAQLRPEKAPRYSIAGELVRERTERGTTALEEGAALSRWGG